MMRSRSAASSSTVDNISSAAHLNICGY